MGRNVKKNQKDQEQSSFARLVKQIKLNAEVTNESMQ
jgi:hypothetical protein